MADFCCVVWRNFFRRDSILVYFSTLCPWDQIFRQINSLVHTVWKSILKCYHAEKFSVKLHNKNLQILILHMDDFLPLGVKTGLCGINEFWRVVTKLEFIVIFFLVYWTISELFPLKNSSTFNPNNYFSHQTLPGLLSSKCSLNLPLLKSIEKPCAKLRENLL